jgi:hypothetical protein
MCVRPNFSSHDTSFPRGLSAARARQFAARASGLSWPRMSCVSMYPGATALQVMPCSATCLATVLVRAMTPPLEAA